MDYCFSDKISGLKPSAIREILKATSQPGVIPFAAGNPDPEAFPVSEIRRISEELLSDNPIAALQYSITEGYPALISRLKERMAAQKCFDSASDELIITSGAQQGVELSCKVLCNEGDSLICETPSFIGSLNAFRSYNVKLCGVSMEDDGINTAELEEKIRMGTNVRAIYVIPNFQNPSGLTMSLEKRREVYALACRYNLIIIEDNPYGDLRFDGEDIPAIKTLDTEGRVIYAGSFSKILAPGLRVGYVSAPREIVSKITVAKQVSDVHTNIWSQMICERFMAQKDMNEHLSGLRAIYKRKYELMRREAAAIGNVSLSKPQGGLFVWATLPEGCDMLSFCKRAVEEYKVAVVPGTAFMVSPEDVTNSFRMNYSTPTDDEIVRGCAALAELSRSMTY